MKKRIYKHCIHINVTDDEKYALDQLGGPTAGFREFHKFWYRNYELYEEQKKREDALKKLASELAGGKE